ncbi:hypothetical protein WJX73_000129 [Symbiochloris irregularis]|uniref:Sulfate transporter n=1 Tax=Symbiochloris irregularis TaxID=706552 RepID=A0AAW1PM27_9CHLO
MSTGRRSALSDSLLQSGNHEANQARHRSAELRLSFDRAHPNADRISESPSQYGRSPLIGSPWPYLVRKSSAGAPAVPPSDNSDSEDDEASTTSRPSHHHDRRTSLPRSSFAFSPVREESAALLAERRSQPLNRPPLPHSATTPEAIGVDAPGGPDPEGQDLDKKPPGRFNFNDILYGIINSIVGVPTMISFAAIIFKAPLYSAYLGQMAKLAFLASAVHQFVFTFASNLPFAVGQVQDVGLIFLSAMATSIAEEGKAKGDAKAEILGTTLITLALATTLVGICIILVGVYKLASLVQYVPLPVVAGYLGYVGYFCLAAGISLACNVEVDSFLSWRNLFSLDAAMRLGPAVASTLLLWTTIKFARHPAALPCVLLAIPLTFWAVIILGLGWDIQTASQHGWVLEGQPKEPFWQLYRLFNLQHLREQGLDWGGLLRQLPKMLALFLVVAFGSSLDVAAIQADTPGQLDYNHELKTVGLSNLVCGLTGAGFTGSYIFSQTIFSMRANVTSRVHGLIIAGTEFALFVIPFSVVQYMPNFFFGSLLMVFGIEITADWLVFSYFKVTKVEFGLLWATYLAIMYAGLEAGIGAGIMMATLYFAFAYARVNVQTFTVVPSRSSAIRTLSERLVLELFNRRMAAVTLTGYIFFGSSISISDEVMTVAKNLVSNEDDKLEEAVREIQAAEKQGSDTFQNTTRETLRAAFAAAPRFILLDFRQVHGLDATAAQSFGTLWSRLRTMGVELVLTQLHPETDATMLRLLDAHGVSVDTDGRSAHTDIDARRAFETMEDGMEHCEAQFLELAVAYGLIKAPRAVMNLEDTLRLQIGADSLPTDKVDLSQAAAQMRPYMQEATYDAHQPLYEVGSSASNLFVVLEGSVEMITNFLGGPSQQFKDLPRNTASKSPDRKFLYGPGSLIGTTDFFLERPRSFSASALKPTRVLVLERSSFNKLATQAPQAAIALLTIVVRTSILDSTQVWEMLDRNNV